MKYLSELRLRISKIRSDHKKENDAVVQHFEKELMKERAARQRKFKDLQKETASRVQNLQRMIKKAREENLVCRKKLKLFQTKIRKRTDSVAQQIQTGREALEKELETNIAQSRRHHSSRAKRNSIFEGLAKLLGRN